MEQKLITNALHSIYHIYTNNLTKMTNIVISKYKQTTLRIQSIQVVYIYLVTYDTLFQILYVQNCIKMIKVFDDIFVSGLFCT